MRRFEADHQVVLDNHTGLMWTRNAALSDFPMTWHEAFSYIRELNRSSLFGHDDWKLPNRRELFSLLCHKTINPSLPSGHPFSNVFAGYYWTSTTCARLPDQAWYLHFGGARVFKGMKHGSYMVWPVRISKNQDKCKVFQTGQSRCFNEDNMVADCRNTGQDGEFRAGLHYDKDRFTEETNVITDLATGMTWLKNADTYGHPVDWNTAFDLVGKMNSKNVYEHNDWRVPDIVDLESLIHMDQHSPALPAGHSFVNVRDFYWSSTTSAYDEKYAWVLYMVDGIVGVGHKPLPEFYLWPVRG